MIVTFVANAYVLCNQTSVQDWYFYPMEGFVSKYGCVFHYKCCLGIFVIFSTQISRKMTTTVRISKSDTPFAVHLRKMHIHLRQQLKLYGKYTFISTSMKFMNANELSITLFPYVLTFNSINGWTIAPLNNQTEQIYFQSRVMVDH